MFVNIVAFAKFIKDQGVTITVAVDMLTPWVVEESDWASITEELTAILNYGHDNLATIDALREEIVKRHAG